MPVLSPGGHTFPGGRTGARAPGLSPDPVPTGVVRSPGRSQGRVRSVCAPVAAGALAVLLLTPGARGQQGEGPPAVDGAAVIPGPVSDFDDGTAAVAFGYGWIGSTDEMAGGSSEVEVQVDGGVLRVEGVVRAGAANTWSGAMFFPGAGPMAPADLSAGTGLRVRVRGGAPGFAVMMFSQATGAMPVVQPRSVSPGWQTLELPFSDFPGIDFGTATAVFFGAVGEEGGFWLELDEVEIY